MKAKFVIVLFTICSISFAQQSTDSGISRNIEVIKEYNPEIREAGKMNTMPVLTDIETKKIKTDYSVRTTPLVLNNVLNPSLDYATAAPRPLSYYKDRFVKAGIGNYISFLGELYTPVYKDQQYLIDLYLKHNSSFGNVKLTPELYPALPKTIESRALSNDNQFRIALLKSSQGKEFSSFAGFRYNQFDYYGYDSFRDSVANVPDYQSPIDEEYRKQAFTNFDLNLRYRTKEFVSHWKYDLQTNYQLFRNKNQLTEHTIFTDLTGNYRVENSIFGANFKMYNIFLNKPSSGSSAMYNFDNITDYTVIKLNPYYSLDGKAGSLVIGIKGFFNINRGKPLPVAPDIYGNVKIINRMLYVYAGVTGDLEVNNYRTVTQLNPYISPDKQIENTHIPIDVYAGTKLNLFDQLNADFFIGYKIIKDAHFFINKRTARDSLAPYYNTFDVVYEKKDAGLFNAGLTLCYDWKEKVNIIFKSQYNKWSLNDTEKPWQLPIWKIDFQTTYNATDYLRFCLMYHFEGGRYAFVNGHAEALKNVSDLSLGVNYKLLSFMNLFLNLNNIFNQEYATWYGYTAHRFNLMGGVSVLF